MSQFVQQTRALATAVLVASSLPALPAENTEFTSNLNYLAFNTNADHAFFLNTKTNNSSFVDALDLLTHRDQPSVCAYRGDGYYFETPIDMNARFDRPTGEITNYLAKQSAQWSNSLKGVRFPQRTNTQSDTLAALFDSDLGRRGQLTLADFLAYRNGSAQNPTDIKLANALDAFANSSSLDDAIRASRNLLKDESAAGMDGFLYGLRCLSITNPERLPGIADGVKDLFTERNLQLFVKLAEYNLSQRWKTWVGDHETWNKFIDFGLRFREQILPVIFQDLQEEEYGPVPTQTPFIRMNRNFSFALKFCARAQDPRAIPFIAPHFGDGYLLNSEEAMIALGTFKGDEAGKILAEMATKKGFRVNPERFVSWERDNHTNDTVFDLVSTPELIVSALARTGSKTYALPALLSFLEKPSPVDRARVIGSIGEFRDPIAIPTLLNELRDPSLLPHVRSALIKVAPENFKQSQSFVEIVAIASTNSDKRVREIAENVSAYRRETDAKFANAQITFRPTISFGIIPNVEDMNRPNIAFAPIQGRVFNLPEKTRTYLRAFIETDRLYFQGRAEITNGVAFSIPARWGGNGSVFVQILDENYIPVRQGRFPFQIDYDKSEISIQAPIKAKN